MSYAVIMVYVDANGSPESRVRLSASLAGKFNANLIGLSALPVPPPFVYDGAIIQQPTDADISATLAKLDAKGDWFRGIADANHARFEWRPVLDYPADALAREARSADLVIIGQMRGPGDTLGSLDPGEVLLKIGRPALVVPDGVSSLRAEHVIVGWKDTREARRAIRDALPFLHEASSVTVVEISDSGEESIAQGHVEDVVRYLMRHRIKALPRILSQQHGSGAAQLFKLAQETGADLIVTGAYGHTRLGEWFFGGVTRDLLANTTISCFMSH